MAKGTLTVRVVGDAAGLQKTLGDAQGKVSKFGDGMQRTGRNLSRRVTAPIIGMGAAVLHTAGQFESEMKRVEALTGATGGSFDQLQGQARELGRTTQFSAGQAAEGMGFLAQAGFDTEDILAAMPGTLELAAAGQLELAQAADIASNVLTGYGKDASEINHVNDVLAATSTSANTNVAQMGEAFSKVGPVAKASGIQFEETSALIGMLGDAGIQGSEAGTTLRGVIAALENPTGQAAKAMEDLGITTHDAQGNLRPMGDILEELEGTGLTSAEAFQIFGRRAGPGMQALLEQGSGALREMTGDLEDSGGTAGEIADKQMEGLNGALARMRSALEGVAISIADSGLLDVVTDLAEKVANFFQRISETNPAILRAGVVIAGLAATIGPLLIMLGLMVKAVAALAPLWLGIAKVFKVVTSLAALKVLAFKALGAVLVAVLSPIGMVVAAIAALAAGVVYAYRNFEWFRDAVDAVWEWIKNAAQAVAEWFTDTLVPWFQDAWDRIVASLEFLAAVTRIVWEAIKEAAQPVIDWFSEHVGPVFEALRDLFSAVWDAISGYFSDAWADIKSVWDSVGGPVMDAIMFVWEATKEGARIIWGAISDYFSDAWDTIKSVWDTIGPPLMDAMAVAWEQAQATVEIVWETIKTVVEGALDFIKTVIDVVTLAIQGDWEGVWEAIKDFGERTWERIKGLVESGIEFVRGTVERVMDGVSGLWDAAWEGIRSFLSDTWESMKDAVSGALDDMVGWMGDLPGRLLSALGNVGTMLFEAGRQIISGLWDGLKSMWENVTGWFSGLGDEIKSLKGPLREDRKMLTAEGEAVMAGFGDGLGTGWRDVERQLSGMTAKVPAVAARGMSLPSASLDGRVVGGDSAPAGESDVVRLLKSIDRRLKQAEKDGGARHFHAEVHGDFAEPITEDGLARRLRRLEVLGS